MKGGAVKFIAATLTGAGWLLPATSLAHQDFIALQNQIANKAHECDIGRYRNASEGIDSYDFGYSKPFIWSWGPQATTLVDGYRLENDLRETNKQSNFRITLSVFIDDGSTINSTNIVPVGFWTNSVYTGPDPQRLYIARAQVQSNYTANGQPFVQVKDLTQLAPTNNEWSLWNLPDLNISGSQTNAQGRVDYGEINVSCLFTNQLRSVGNKAISTNDLTENQVSGLEYVLVYGTNSNGSAQVVNGTNLVYAPSLSFVGTNNVGVQLNWVDGSVTNNLGSLNYQFAVTNQNTAPQAFALSISGPKGQTNFFGFPVSDADNDPLTVSVLQQGTNGNAYVTGNTNGYYVPGSSLPLVDFLRYSVSDGQGGFATNTVSVNLTNRPPMLTNSDISASKGIAITNRAPAGDPDGDNWAAYVAQQGTNGLASILNGTNFTYAPNTNAPVSDVFRLYVVDGYGAGSTTNTVSVSLTNRPPVAPAQTNIVVPEVTNSVPLNAHDPDGDGLSYTMVAWPTNGTLSGAGSSRRYAFSGSNWYRQDAFAYRVNDGYADSGTGSVTLNVAPFIREPYSTGISASGTNMNLSAMVPPARLLSVQAKGNLNETNWVTEHTEQTPYATNELVPYSKSLPKGTNRAKVYRLENTVSP